jgi:hypothetical protein
MSFPSENSNDLQCCVKPFLGAMLNFYEKALFVKVDAAAATSTLPARLPRWSPGTRFLSTAVGLPCKGGEGCSSAPPSP